MAKGPAKKTAKKPVKPVAKTSAKPAAKAKAPEPKAKSVPAKPGPKAVLAPRTPPPPPPLAPISPVRPPAQQAVAEFERGMAALHHHDYKAALTVFQGLLTNFPSEGFLTDRARVYSELATRELQRQPSGSGNIEERLTEATLALNNHNDEEAARLATNVLREDRSQDLAAYLLAVVASRRGDVETALAHLRQAIETNPECRLQARQDEEFDPLMDSDEFHALIEAPVTPTPGSAAAQARKPVRKTGR